jgi:hypothetical protein
MNICSASIAASMVALLSISIPKTASALEIVQSVTNSQPVSASNVTGTVALLPNSVFEVTFKPFVGNALGSAVFSFVNAFTGTVTTGPDSRGTTLNFDTTVTLTGFLLPLASFFNIEDVGGAPNSVLPASLDETAAFDLLTFFPNPFEQAKLDAFITGSLPLEFAQSAFGDPVFFASGGAGVVAVTGTLTTTATLTYTYTGDGALQTDVPEPTSLALYVSGVLGLQLFRRHRTSGKHRYSK